MELRHVVTCILTRPSDGAVLLGKRSERVATYPGRWAAISGSVEGVEPLAQAWREVAEETGLSRDDLAFVAGGRRVRCVDWALGTVWVVHPFLFRCRTPDKVRADWEHVALEWTEPARIGSLLTVPNLADACESALAGRDADWRRVLRQVRDDREHGAEELGLWTLEALEMVAGQAAPAGGAGAFGEEMKAACREAAHARPAMAPVRSAALQAYEACRNRTPEEARRALAALMDERERAPLAAARAAGRFIPEGARVVTLSCSFTVLCALKDPAGRVGRLTVAESRPACEGRRTAELAASFGIPTELVTDAAAVRAASQSDLILFGADAVCADGSVVNKVGTFGLCCAAARAGVARLCLATGSKVLPSSATAALEEMEPGELGAPIAGVTGRNVYFEVVPFDLVRSLLIGGDVATLEQVRLVAGRMEALDAELFGAG